MLAFGARPTCSQLGRKPDLRFPPFAQPIADSPLSAQKQTVGVECAQIRS